LALIDGEILQSELSRWSRSRAKRILDVAAVLLCSPILLPLLASIAVAVFVTSGMPVIFRQHRVGRGGVPFAIYKFRTMRPSDTHGRSAMAIESAGRITRLGSLLRRTKLDELPQLLNVLAGEMSLVGPRPKVPEQQLQPLSCRPGLTGVATLAFAREEALLMRVPPQEWAELFHNTILPAKRRMDAQYMQKATLWSDLRILADTVLVRWRFYAPEIQLIRRKAESCEAPSSQAASIYS
jgi:lipopolysaccharide/colanic/teichoic acid biosynthesis glycosyltransferase